MTLCDDGNAPPLFGLASPESECGVDEKSGRHVLDGVEPETVALRLVKNIEHRADEIGIHVLGDRDAVGAVERTPWAALDHRQAGVHVVTVAAGMTDEDGLR